MAPVVKRAFGPFVEPGPRRRDDDEERWGADDDLELDGSARDRLPSEIVLPSSVQAPASPFTRFAALEHMFELSVCSSYEDRPPGVAAGARRGRSRALGIARRASGGTRSAHGAWVDVLPGLGARIGPAVLAISSMSVPWQAERRQMYERVVDVPRLLSFYGESTSRCPIPC